MSSMYETINLQNEVTRLEAEVERLMDGMETAWAVIANAHSGDWEEGGSVWWNAAVRWRDEHWHTSLDRNPRAQSEEIDAWAGD